MKQKDLDKWLKVIIGGMGICGAVIYFLVIPSLGRDMVDRYPEFSGRFWPWLIFILGSAIPCYTVLVLGWRIAGNIGADRSFSDENARYMKWIAWLAAADSGYFFMGNIILLLINMSHPGVVLASMVVVFAGVVIAVAAGALSHLVAKAASLQEQSDLTI